MRLLLTNLLSGGDKILAIGVEVYWAFITEHVSESEKFLRVQEYLMHGAVSG